MKDRKDYACTLTDAEIIQKQEEIKTYANMTIKYLLTDAIIRNHPIALEIKKVKDSQDATTNN